MLLLLVEEVLLLLEKRLLLLLLLLKRNASNATATSPSLLLLLHVERVRRHLRSCLRSGSSSGSSASGGSGGGGALRCLPRGQHPRREVRRPRLPHVPEQRVDGGHGGAPGLPLQGRVEQARAQRQGFPDAGCCAAAQRPSQVVSGKQGVGDVDDLGAKTGGWLGLGGVACSRTMESRAARERGVEEEE